MVVCTTDTSLSVSSADIAVTDGVCAEFWIGNGQITEISICTSVVGDISGVGALVSDIVSIVVFNS